MAATTITRESMTDGVTAWTVARIGSAIYDKIDALIGADLTFGGVISAEGFGTHAISTGGTGTNRFQIRNTTSGTANRSSFDVGNNSSAELGRFIALSSAHTPASYLLASGVVLEANGAGGLSIATTDAAGDIRLYTGSGPTLRLTVSDAGAIDVAGTLTLGVAPVLTANATALSAPGGLVTLPGAQGYIELTAANFVDTDIVGLGSGAAGKVAVISNVDSGHSYTVYHEAAGATAADRFFLPGDADITLAYGEAITVVYSATISRWVACLG